MSWRLDLGELPVGWEMDGFLDVVRKNYTKDEYEKIPRDTKAEIIIHQDTPVDGMMVLVPMIGPPGRTFSDKDKMPGWLEGLNNTQVRFITEFAYAIDSCVENGKVKEVGDSLTIELQDLIDALREREIPTELYRPKPQ
jgi:hypothetical protein